MPSDDRDQQFDRALARHLRSASPDAACPDTEILAAYHERALSLEEMAHWKTHVAACARCQETLALLEQTEPVAAKEWEKEGVLGALRADGGLAGARDLAGTKPAAAEMRATAAPAPVAIPAAPKVVAKTRRRIPWSIVVPASALAASLLVWVVVHEGARFSVQEKARVQVAENHEAAPPVSKAASESGKTELRDEGSAALQSYTRADRKAPALTSPAQHAQSSLPAYSAAPPAAPKESWDSELDKLRQLEANKPAVSSGAGAPSGLVAGKRASVPARVAAKSVPRSAGGPLAANQMQNQMQNQMANQYSNQAPAPPANQGAIGGANQSADQAKVQAESQPASQEKKDVQSGRKQGNETVSVSVSAGAVEVTSAEISAATTNISSPPQNGRQVSALLSLESKFIAAPDHKHGWRVGPAGKIERSTDAGKSWKAQRSGVTSDLLSGSAPSENVCWIVGNAGTLLLTTDGGKHWKPLTSPISDDLGGVHAVDAQHATIWDVPRRRSFETADGGLTWSQVANE